MANALTTLRLLLVLPFAWLMASPDARHAALAAVVLAAAIVTDLLDGVIARRRSTASAAGQIFDHTADCLFVTSGLGAGALRHAIPWILPILVAAAFAQYVIDSRCLVGAQPLRPSRLGRWNGILYFAPLGGDIFIRLQPLLAAVVWLLVASTVVSMGERLVLLVTARRRGVPASPAGERGDRSPR